MLIKTRKMHGKRREAMMASHNENTVEWLDAKN